MLPILNIDLLISCYSSDILQILKLRSQTFNYYLSYIYNSSAKVYQPYTNK